MKLKQIFLTIIAFLRSRKRNKIIVLGKQEYLRMCEDNCGHDIKAIPHTTPTVKELAIIAEIEKAMPYKPKYWTIAQLIRSQTAINRGLPNIPNETEVANLYGLMEHLLDPMAEMWYAKYPERKLTVNLNLSSISGFRTWEINGLVGGSRTSDHPNGSASDICAGGAKWNRKLFAMVRDAEKLQFDQMYGITGRNSGPFASVHMSYRIGANRNQLITV